MEIMCQERIMSKGLLGRKKKKKYIELFMLGWIANPIRDNKFIPKEKKILYNYFIDTWDLGPTCIIQFSIFLYTQFSIIYNSNFKLLVWKISF